MTKYPKRSAYINWKDMNKLLLYVRKYCIPVFRKKTDLEPFKHYAFIEDLRVSFKVTVKIGAIAKTYVTRLDKEEIVQQISGVDSFTTLSKYYKVPRVAHIEKIGSAIPLLYYNENYNGTRQLAWCYDLNSAYADAMRGPMPDTTKVVGMGRRVKEGEIGFFQYDTNPDEMLASKNDLIMVGPGHMADIIFKAMPSPFINFVEVWFGRKKQAKTKKEYNKAKGMLNYCIGYLQLVNPFLRATVVCRCNERIRSLMDENTLYCNTDSLVSRVPRDDLIIGKDLGEWKLEHKGLFAYKDFNYQWNYDAPTYRGEPKSWFKKGWDILVDDIPEPRNIFELDKDTLQLRRIDYGKEEETSL